MSRSRRWAMYPRGLVLGIIVCLSWPASYAADLEPIAGQPAGRPLARVGLRGEALSTVVQPWPRASGAGRKAPRTQHAAPTSAAVDDSRGVEFWLTFPGNLRFFPSELQELSLFIAGDLDTAGTVCIPALEFSASFTVTAGTATTVTLPPTAARNSSDLVDDNGIHVTAMHDVAVYGFNRRPTTADGYLGLPTASLGTEYIVLAYQNFSPLTGTQLAVVATADETSVTITPSVATGERPAGVPDHLSLQQGQTYQLRNNDHFPSDLSGTIITADKPIAVFAGHECARVPPAFFSCDHLVEQLPPIVTWGKNFVTMPLAGRAHGDTFRFLASADGTHVSVNGTPLATLMRGQFFEHIIPVPAHISADQPILVAQYANGSEFDRRTGDPFMMLIPLTEQFLENYTVTTPTAGFESHFVNVVAPDTAIDTLALDGLAIPAASFVPIGASGFSGAQVPLTAGSHTVTGALPFGISVYGFAVLESYGYPGGMALAPVALVASLELTPEAATNPLGTEPCVTAIVSDRQPNPVAGVRVAFAVSGANPSAGVVVTAENGQAQFCYSGVHVGTDTLVASVGTMTDTATKVWVEPVLQFSDGINALTVDSVGGACVLSYVVDGVPLLCSGDRARIDDGLLTITSLCREDLRDVVRAIGPADASVTVQLNDHLGETGDDRVIRRFILRRQSHTE
jgi:IgGFc binding protein/Bacterial Ig-like domain (group 1)